MPRLSSVCELLDVPNQLRNRAESLCSRQLRRDFIAPSSTAWSAFCRSTRASAMITGPALVLPGAYAERQVTSGRVSASVTGLAIAGLATVGLALLVGTRAFAPTDFVRADPGLGRAIFELGVLGLPEYASLRAARSLSRKGQEGTCAYRLCMGCAIGTRIGLLPIRLAVDSAIFLLMLLGATVGAVVGAMTWGWRAIRWNDFQLPETFLGDYGYNLKALLVRSSDRKVHLPLLSKEFLVCAKDRKQRRRLHSEIETSIFVLTCRSPYWDRPRLESMARFWQAIDGRDVSSSALQNLRETGPFPITSLNVMLRDLRPLEHSDKLLDKGVGEMLNIYFDPSSFERGVGAGSIVRQSKAAVVALADKRVIATHPDKLTRVWGDLSLQEKNLLALVHDVARSVRDYVSRPEFSVMVS